MNEALIAVSILWTFIFVYAILGSIDFGASFWAMVYARREPTQAGSIANRFLSPSWEVTNVFLVLLVVTIVVFFPRAAYAFGTVLLIPGSLILILLTLRSTFMVFTYTAPRYKGILRIISGATGLLIPGLLVSVLPITSGGFINTVQLQLLFGKLLQSPNEYAYISFGLSSELFLSSLFLADYAREARDETAYTSFRRHAIGLGPATLITAMLTTWTIPDEASWLKSNLAAQGPWFTLSVVAFAFGYSALWWPQRKKQKKAGYPRVAVLSIIIQYALATYAYGVARFPYIMYPDVTADNSMTNPAMFKALLISYTVGLTLLVPGFILFWRLFMKDKQYLEQED